MSNDKTVCPRCSKEFSLRGLNYHLPKCILKHDLTCKYCNIVVQSKRNLERHLTICEEYKNFIIVENESLKIEMIDLKKQVLDYQQTIKQHKDEIHKLNIDLDEKKNELNEKKNELLEQKKYFSELIRNIKPTVINTTNNNTTNTTNNIANQLSVHLPKITDDDIYSIVYDIFNREMLPDDENAFAKTFCEEFSKNKTFVSDRSRNILVWKNNEEKQIRDHKGIQLSKKVFDVGQPIWQEKKEELWNDIKSSRDNNTLVAKLYDWRDNISSFIRKDDEKINNFGKKLVSLSQEKTSFHLTSETEELKEQSPLEPLFYKMFWEDSSFIAFSKGFAGLGSYIKHYFDKSLLICETDIDSVEFRYDPDQPPIILTNQLFRSICSKLITDDLKYVVTLNFSEYDDPITDFVESKHVTLSRKQISASICELTEVLRDVNAKEWDAVFEVLLT